MDENRFRLADMGGNEPPDDDRPTVHSHAELRLARRIMAAAGIVLALAAVVAGAVWGWLGQ